MDTLRYETPSSEFASHPGPYIFLAGPTVRSHQQHLLPSWRLAATDEFASRRFNGTLIIPEFTEFKKPLPDLDLPIWEYAGLKMADCIMFWIPRTRELIGLTTNVEIGYWLRDRHRVVYGRPDDAYHIDYLDTLWLKDFQEHGVGTPVIYKNLPDTVAAALRMVKS